MDTRTTFLPPPCNRALQRLWEYLDDELPRREAERIRHHLTECRSCGPYAASEKRFLSRIAAVRLQCAERPAVRRRIVGRLVLQRILPDWKDG
jgi:hypothetical protein